MSCSDQTSNAGDGPLRLTGTLDTYGAAALRDALRQALAGSSGLTLDLSAVDSCDFSIIQLLCSARRSAEQAGKRLAITALSEGARRACADLGIPPATFATSGDQ